MIHSTVFRRGAVLVGSGMLALALSACAPSALAASDPPVPAAAEPTADDGYIADGSTISPFDAGHLAIANLEQALRDAVQQAALDAGADGVELVISSGWRSARYQEVLLDEAIAGYGSEAEARRWVSTPDESAHVTGNAVDVGPTDAMSWLSQHGSDYGLCQTYANEMWHYQLAVEPGGTCPVQSADSTEG